MRENKRSTRCEFDHVCPWLLMRVYACMQISPARLLCKIHDRSMLMEIVNASTRILIGCR